MWRKCDYFGNPQNLKEDYGFSCELGSDDSIFQAEVTICVIVLVLMVMALGFSVYSLKHPRHILEVPI